ncbi:MAG: phosphatidylglycerol lysyltransferase domain-containing protein [Rhodovarius sp.]|nr:phosphatidylglycerol lysyltransferase domain-containing protein [Rhodovarius sp.]
MLRALKRYGPTLFGVALLIGAIFVVQREFRSLSVAEVRAAMAAIPPAALWSAAGLTVLAYAVLAVYDKLGSIYAGRPASWIRSLLASFCGYSLAHNLGFAAVSGAAVRLRLYSAWGYSAVQIAKVIGFTSLTFGLGGMALGGLVLLTEPEVIPFFGEHLPDWALRLLALPLWGAVAAYIVLSRFYRAIRLFGQEIELPGLRMALAQTGLATIDVAVTAAIFYALLPPAEGLSFVRFVGIYLAAYALGIFASVPGGLGVFDSAILLGLAPYLDPAEVVGALLVFRLFYYIVPLFMAGTLFAGFELSQRGAVLERFQALVRGAGPLEPPLLAGLVALSGALLLFLGALPDGGPAPAGERGAMLAATSPFAASLAGSLLLVMGYGLARRLHMAWAGAAVLLPAGAVTAWLGGHGPAVVPLLGVLALLLAMRRAFYRRSRLRTEPLSPEAAVPLATVAVCGLTLALVGQRVEMRQNAWWEVVVAADAPPGLRFTVGLTAVLLLAGAARLLRPARIRPLPYDARARQLLAEWHVQPPPRADGLLLGEAGRAAIAFSRHPQVWVAHGDPAGDAEDAVSAIWRFRDLCERMGVRPAFLDVGEERLGLYADIGLTAVPMPGRPGRFLACRAELDLERVLALA